jgi:predicted DNA-binding protein
MKKHTTIRLSEETRDIITMLRKKTHRNMSNLIEHALYEYAGKTLVDDDYIALDRQKDDERIKNDFTKHS